MAVQDVIFVTLLIQHQSYGRRRSSLAADYGHESENYKLVNISSL
jgi:hypothetical protein